MVGSTNTTIKIMLQKRILKNPVLTQCRKCGETGHMPREWLGLRKECRECNDTFLVTEYTEDSNDA